jgi:ParB family chromosome partitioning protein
MERALKTVQNRLPDAIPDINAARDALILKFRGGVIGNITDFRKLSKIATSVSNLGIREAKARRAVREIFAPSKRKGIQEVYAEQFELRYDERKIALSIDSIYEFLENSSTEEEDYIVADDLRARLLKLHDLIERLLGQRDAV